ncbi:hypothetical protein CVT25_000766, partial [Psilocybe cyanescens]
MVQITNSLIVVAAVAVPAFAAPVLEARGKLRFPRIHRKVGVAATNAQPQRREFNELDAREPWKVSSNAIKNGGKAIVGAAGFAGTVAAINAQPHQREFDELDAREPIFGAIFKGATKVAGKFLRREDEEEFFAREFEDEDFWARAIEEELEAREPGFGSFIKGIGKTASKFIREDGG